ncbi:hypothetical protein BDB00DRAFT_873137 [Zychaea mexicana]|uniref:uncharacterized protein n=1 Tax=Zychaea mexicana TaxID=64656 RepID=UPI0022FED04B|nr:uncharacterized protein BDB00DRAFT_873137 [Zychaea mexicana]KAI9492742.1 hypothetical protein BDB00DRAFT_873137 [Zychaea mexicana]
MGLNEAGARELAVVAAPAVVVPAPVHVVQLDELSVQSMALRKNDAQPSGADASLPVSPSLPPAVDILPAVPNGIDVPSFAVVDEAPIDQVVRNPSPVTLPSSSSLDQLPSQLPVAGDFAAEDHGVVVLLDEEALCLLFLCAPFAASPVTAIINTSVANTRFLLRSALLTPPPPLPPGSSNPPPPSPLLAARCPVRSFCSCSCSCFFFSSTPPPSTPPPTTPPSSTPPPSPPQPHSPCILPRTSSSHPPP